jgi:hypothetical protein
LISGVGVTGGVGVATINAVTDALKGDVLALIAVMLLAGQLGASKLKLPFLSVVVRPT